MKIEMSDFAYTIYKNKYSMDRKEEWPDTARRVVESVMKPYTPALVDETIVLVESRKFMPGGRYLYAAGRKYPQVNNCFLMRAEDSREGWAGLGGNCINALMTGGGIGVDYSAVRGEDSYISGMGGRSTGPCALMQIINESGRHIRQGGSRRSAIWAGLRWDHPDCEKFIRLKDWPGWLREQKLLDFNTPAPMDGTNISVILNREFFDAHQDDGHPKHHRAVVVYGLVVRRMLKTGEPGFSVDYEDELESLRNACTEVTSADDLDMCNLGSLNLARIENVDEMWRAVELATAFLVCGTLYSKLPVEAMYRIREKNRRLGLGLMGVHEWLLKRDRRYGPDAELGKWLDAYAMSGAVANLACDRLGISRSVATRAVAPNGTISIVAETTSSAEPVMYAAYKRRYLDGNVWKAQYVIDPTARRLVDDGCDPELIEDSLTLAEDYGRRIEMQAWLQRYVDHGISSTINLPPWGSSINNETTVDAFGKKLMEYLPGLRGITAYPDGARGGQPITRVSYAEAVKSPGVEFLDGAEDGCRSGVCGV